MNKANNGHTANFVTAKLPEGHIMTKDGIKQGVFQLTELGKKVYKTIDLNITEFYLDTDMLGLKYTVKSNSLYKTPTVLASNPLELEALIRLGLVEII